jgi:hypothetical protein
MFTLQESAGMSSLPTGLPGLATTVPFDPSITYRPNTNFFDNRTIFNVTQADFVLQKSSRLSFDVGGAEFLNRFRSSALYSLNGTSARGDIQYRLSRRSTLGLVYAYNRFSYSHIISTTDYHTFSLSFASRFTRTLELSAYGGMGHEETKTEQLAPVDPTIALLLGITAAPQIVHAINWNPTGNARLSRIFHHGVAYVSGGHSVTPGNGLFLTSSTSTVMGGANYTGIRRTSLSVQGQYSTATSIGNILGGYADLQGGVSATRDLRHGVGALFSLTATKYQSGSFVNYNHVIYNFRIGLRFSPSDVPLRIW